MAINLFSKNGVAGAGVSTQSQGDRPAATVWLNIGVNVPMPNPDTGKSEVVFVALPVGIPLDTMEQMAMRGNSTGWHNMVQAKNWLLDELKKAAEGLEPGGDVIVDDLQIQIKRVSGKAAPSDGENPLLAALAGTFGKAA